MSVSLARGASAAERARQNDAPIFAYVGSYTPNGDGIRAYRMDPKTGVLTAFDALPATNPS